jgi:hypothetical protein
MLQRPIRLAWICPDEEYIVNADQLRRAFSELNGQRNLRIEFDSAETMVVRHALLIPAEQDSLVKLTDGSHEFIIDAERVAWVEIG